MSWLAWIGWSVALIAIFVVWDILFCGGRRCRGLIDRL
jgi:hypothetical protein